MNNPTFSVNCNRAAPRAIPHMETIRRTAQIFNLPEHFVRELAKSGTIVAVRAGTKYLINIDRLTDFLNTTKSPAQVEAEAETENDIHPIPVNYR